MPAAFVQHCTGRYHEAEKNAVMGFMPLVLVLASRLAAKDWVATLGVRATALSAFRTDASLPPPCEGRLLNSAGLRTVLEADASASAFHALAWLGEDCGTGPLAVTSFSVPSVWALQVYAAVDCSPLT